MALVESRLGRSSEVWRAGQHGRASFTTVPDDLLTSSAHGPYEIARFVGQLATEGRFGASLKLLQEIVEAGRDDVLSR